MNKEQQIEEMARVVCEHFDCDMVGQPCTKCKTYDKHCYTIHQAEILYNAGYRKTFTSDFASDTQKAYKEGYIKGIEETEAEIEILKIQNKNLGIAFDRLEAKNERLETQLQQANAGIVNCIGCHLVELNAVKDFADKVKEYINNKVIADFDDSESVKYYTVDLDEFESEIDELLKEYEK